MILRTCVLKVSPWKTLSTQQTKYWWSVDQKWSVVSACTNLTYMYNCNILVNYARFHPLPPSRNSLFSLKYFNFTMISIMLPWNMLSLTTYMHKYMYIHVNNTSNIWMFKLLPTYLLHFSDKEGPRCESPFSLSDKLWWVGVATSWSQAPLQEWDVYSTLLGGKDQSSRVRTVL